MSLNDNKGCSKTTRNGQFSWEPYYSTILRKDLVQWDYRDTKGQLHSGIAPNLLVAIDVAERKSGEKIDITL